MANQVTTPVKITSPGSQYSVSVSDEITVPNPTPLPEALDSEVVDPPPEIDFHAMSKTLATIAESLNESAEEAMLLTPPINTPAITSPAASVVCRYPRSRGLSTIGDRLARAMTEGRKFNHHNSDITSTSGRSVRSSLPADDESDGELSDIRGDEGRDRHDIPIALGSPRANPMGLISFTSNDLTDRAPVPFNIDNPNEDASATAIGTGSHKPKSQISILSDETQDTGVTEMSTWKEEVEGRFERALQCLENLAHDEHLLDPSKPVEQYYEAHLKRLLSNRNRKIPVSIDLVGGS